MNSAASKSIAGPVAVPPPPPAASVTTRPLPTVFIDRQALGNLRQLLGNAAGNQPAQVGGLLLGRISAGPRSSIVVSQFKSLPWDANRGGAPYLMQVHEKVLEQTMRRLHQPQSPVAPSVIGFWRTSLQGEGGPSDEDWELLHRCIEYGPRAVSLLITPVTQTSSVGAAFFLGFDGLNETSVVELLVEYENSEPAKTSDSSVWKALAGFAKRWALLACSGGLLLLAAFMAHLSSSRGVDVASETLAPRLELQAARVGNDFVVVWARSTPAGRSFDRGKLTIDDSGTRKEFVFDKPQMAGARMLYQPMSQDVSFRLDAITDDGQEVTESIRAYLAVPPAAPTPVDLLEKIGPKDPTPDAASIRAAQGFPYGGMMDDQPWSGPDRRRNSKPRLYQYVPPRRSPTPVVQMPEPPQLDSKPELVRNSLIEVPAERLPGAPLPAPIASTAASREKPEAALTNPLERLSPPVAIQTPKPLYNKQVANMLSGPTEVVVHVKIDSSGRVIEAQADTPPSYVYSLLGQSATAAARSWRFKPATLDGKAVASETDLRFRFVR